jgi:hypothetical protein
MKLFEHIRAELPETIQFEVVGPPGMWHGKTCLAAVECLKKRFPNVHVVDVSDVQDTGGIWRKFASAAKIDFGNGDTDRLAERIRQGGNLFVVNGLDTACAGLLGISPNYAIEIKNWLNGFVVNQVPAILCNKFQIRGLIGLIIPHVEGSTRTPDLLTFADFGRCDAWKPWSDRYLSTYKHLTEPQRETLRARAGQNPEGLRIGLKGTRPFKDRLAAIERFHDNLAKEIRGLIPQSHQPDFISVVLGRSQEPANMRELLENAGLLPPRIVGQDKEPQRVRWEAIWSGETRQAAAISGRAPS